MPQTNGDGPRFTVADNSGVLLRDICRDIPFANRIQMWGRISCSVCVSSLVSFSSNIATNLQQGLYSENLIQSQLPPKGSTSSHIL